MINVAVPGALLCLCGPMTDGGLHHVAIISPDGYYRLEHASFSVLQTPFAHAELSDAASATVTRLGESERCNAMESDAMRAMRCCEAMRCDARRGEGK